MTDLKKQQQKAIEAVARRFSATWEKGRGSCDGYVMIAGKRVAVDVKTLKKHGTGQGDGAKPRLRFDKVVTRLMERLRATLGETVPDGMTVLLTIRDRQTEAEACARVRRRPMACCDQRKRQVLFRGVSLHLFANAHSDRIQEDSRNVWRRARRAVEE